MNDSKAIKLGSDAIDYLRECLLNGHTLSRYLLDTQDLHCGTIFTFLPSSVSSETANNYRHGPLLPEPSPETHVYDKAEDGSAVTMVPIPNTAPLLAHIVHDYLRVDRGRVCIFEEALARPSDPCMKTSKKSDWLAFGHEVYYLLTWRGAAIWKIKQTIEDATCIWPPLIGVMTSLTERDDFAVRRRNLSLDNLKQFADSAEKIIVGAYDGEGYLIWERSATST